VWNAISSLLIFSQLACCAALSAPDRIEALEPHMGTMFRIVLYADDPAHAHEAFRAAFDRVERLDNELSDYKPNSELNRACRDAVGRDMAISDDLYVVLRASELLAERTKGAFDITVGPLIRLWREARKTKQLPAPNALAAAMRLTGYGKLHLGNHTLHLDTEGMQLDLGAIAKGYAADEALRILRDRGYPQALVAASGDIAVGDPPPGKTAWEIGVDSLHGSGESFTRILQLHNAAVSTSGDTEQYVVIGGVRYSHIVNPMTGNGLTRRIGVSVIASRGIDADSLATAASVITEQHGPEAGLGLISGSGAKGVIVTETGGAFTEFETAGVPKRITKPISR
jgi:thiamine biosynthesis lipoprotein